jgi:hypothetical protein
MPKSDYFSNAVLNEALCGTTFTAVATRYLALYTTVPTTAGAGTETTGGAYARQPVTFSTSSGATKSSSNTADVLFPQCTVLWGTLLGWALMDAVTAGNQLYSGSLAVSKLIDVGDQYKVPSGSLQIQES